MFCASCVLCGQICFTCEHATRYKISSLFTWPARKLGEQFCNIAAATEGRGARERATGQYWRFRSSQTFVFFKIKLLQIGPRAEIDDMHVHVWYGLETYGG